jgi:glycosyltransferase involved in cell wall biosynthesis
MSVLQFITAIPWNVHGGSGCYVGVRTLADGLHRLGVTVTMVTPRTILPVYTGTRLLFNETLRWKRFTADATIGIDADGYAVAGRRNAPPHIACIKGVLGDAVRFESGMTRASMAVQAWLEAQHARRADLVITISRYCAERLQQLYGVRNVSVVPELIDVEGWRTLFRNHESASPEGKFTVLCVCRFYPRKRLDVLLRAAYILREKIPELEIRIVGNGPQRARLRHTAAELHLEPVVHWLGDISLAALAAEYNRAHVFCLPSVQEGFGIVFLEAMAAGKPIVAARAAAVPEVVRHGILVEPDNPEALAEGLIRCHRDPDLCDSLGSAGLRDVEQYDIGRVSRKFLAEVAKVAPRIVKDEGIEHAL